MTLTVLWVALGAAVGAPARYLTDRAVQRRHDSVFPWGTLTVNLAGSFVLGLLVSAGRDVSPAVAAVLGTGFCGALTTYSTFSYEILRLVEDRARFYAVADVMASLLGGFGAAGLGWTLGSWLT
jgi:CrcB protein